jgi:hypothetical protein
MAQQRLLTAGKYGGEQVAAPNDSAVADRVDATVKRAQPAISQPPLDAPVAESQ